MKNKQDSDTYKTIKLTEMCETGGCSAKFPPTHLKKLLNKIEFPENSNLLTSFKYNEDAAIFQIDDRTKIVTTVDVNTPLVDDARIFGQIAAANALSDVYAMGGQPLTCLNLCGIPKGYDTSIIDQLLLGAYDKVTEAGAILVGGHTIYDPQLWFGLSVTGIIKSNIFWQNHTINHGDMLILTKPIGSGVLFSAYKFQAIASDDIAHCIETATLLNKKAAEILMQYDIQAATDISGFGLLGHLTEMLLPRCMKCDLFTKNIPIFTKSQDFYKQGFSTSITSENRKYVDSLLQYSVFPEESFLDVLCDPQTNGGLLAAVKEIDALSIVEELQRSGFPYSSVIGRISEAQKVEIQLQ